MRLLARVLSCPVVAAFADLALRLGIMAFRHTYRIPLTDDHFYFGWEMRRVIDAAERITERKIPRKLGPRRPGYPAVLVASKEKLKRTLRWEASQSWLEEIIQSARALKQKHPHGYSESSSAQN